MCALGVIVFVWQVLPSLKEHLALCRSMKVEGEGRGGRFGHADLEPSSLMINKGTLGPKWRL